MADPRGLPFGKAKAVVIILPFSGWLNSKDINIHLKLNYAKIYLMT